MTVELTPETINNFVGFVIIALIFLVAVYVAFNTSRDASISIGGCDFAQCIYCQKWQNKKNSIVSACGNCGEISCQECRGKMIWNFEDRSWWCYECCATYESTVGSNYDNEFIEPNSNSNDE
jgi:hypothetical protein